MMAALTEEVGELAKALLSEPWERVVAEAVQVAAMAIRVAEEGDSTFAEYRARQGLDAAPMNGALLPVPGKVKKGAKKKEPSAWALSFADWFRALLPEKIHLKTGWRVSWAICFDELVDAGKRDDVELAAVCEFARGDSFWSKNFFSPCKLLDRNPQGVYYYDVWMAAMNANKAPAVAALKLR